MPSDRDITEEGSVSCSDAPGMGRRDWLKLGAGAALVGFSACDGRGALEELRPPAGAADDAWRAVRGRFLLEPGRAYLNNASLGMPPREVVDAVCEGYRHLSSEPLDGKHLLQDQIAEEVVPRLATLLGASPSEVVLTRNASEALHLQTTGLDLSPGDEVLITSQEHPAGRRPWLFRAARDGVAVNEVFVPSPLPTEEEIVEAFARAITPRTRAIAFCHVTRGGHRYPVRALCEMARSRGLVSLVDGAQAVGQFPTHLGELGCDAYSASLHKWMLGPSGTGFLYVRAAARDRIRSAFAHDASLESPAFDPPGTLDLPVRAALSSALDFVETLGLERIEARCRFLSDHLKARLSESSRVTLLSSNAGQSAPGSTIFEVEGIDALEAVPLIESRADAHIDEHQRDGHNAIRISTHVYNTTEEVDRVVAALLD
ncbi:MAG: aminotransferase class V-fold PLP-dependent enzyme [Gemmatimonadales bacterium]|nr:MAG: aminotransferase class V-fold PLP-dependent enzyme [Gemmatimonadales bacterium]